MLAQSPRDCLAESDLITFVRLTQHGRFTK